MCALKSVFIINSDVYDRYQKYSYFFSWFEDHKDISLCVWNKYASEEADIDALVPQLFDIVKNVPEWNAYIIDEPFDSSQYITEDFDKSTQCSINPYERAGHNKEFDMGKDPLLRLVYFLGGRGVEELEYINNYNFKALKPNQIFLITPRIFENLEMQKVFLQNQIRENNRKLMDDPKKLLVEEDARSLEYSDFWLRYEYPPNCRFLVFDMPNIENVMYEDTWFMFWMAVLTVALNVYNSSEIGAYKLYKLGIDISNEEFKQFINKYYLGLVDACTVANREIETEIAAVKAAREDTTSHSPVATAPINVDFPGVDFSTFELSQDWFGITKDRPELDELAWSRYREGVELQTKKLFKAVNRGKNEAVDRMNRTFEVDLPLLLNLHLTRYDIEDMIELLNASELDMLGMKTGIVASRAVFEQNEELAAHEVKKAMRPRLFTLSYFLVMVLGVVVSIAGMVPFMISSAKISTKSFWIALLISLVTGGIIGLSSYIMLRVCRRDFGVELSKYSNSLQNNIGDVTANADVQSKYLTALLDYMEKFQMIKSGKIDKNSLEKLEQLTAVRNVFEDAIDRCKMIASLCHVQLTNDRDDVEPIIFVPGTKIYLHDDTDGMRISLNSHSDRLETPFTFIGRLNIFEEDIYSSSKYYQGNLPEKLKRMEAELYGN